MNYNEKRRSLNYCCSCGKKLDDTHNRYCSKCQVRVDRYKKLEVWKKTKKTTKQPTIRRHRIYKPIESIEWKYRLCYLIEIYGSYTLSKRLNVSQRTIQKWAFKSDTFIKDANRLNLNRVLIENGFENTDFSN